MNSSWTTGRGGYARRGKLAIESLENRRLLAADFVLSEPVSPASLAIPSLEADGSQQGNLQRLQHDSQGAQFHFRSLQASSFKLGEIEDQITVQGRLGYKNRVDVFEFEVDSSSDVEIELATRWGDADMRLYDRSGSQIAASNNAARMQDAIDVELLGGSYYLGIFAEYWWGAAYQLDLSVSPRAPEPATPGVIDGTRTGAVSPLKDVAYYGGTIDWSVNDVFAPEAWAAGYQGQGVTVAVVDTGVDIDHPDLAHNIFVNSNEIAGNGIDDDGNGFVDDVSGIDLVDGDNVPRDMNGHGTHVAGIVAAAKDGRGATGIAPQAKILPVRVLDARGAGSASKVALGIRYAADMGADIINLSLGGGYSPLIEAAIHYAGSLGSSVIAAAGNSGSAQPDYPARFSQTSDAVLSVGATDRTDRIAGFSNQVGITSTVQVDAPGVSIFSTLPGGGYGWKSGTSMAAPQVSGLAALALSAQPDLKPSELRRLITQGATESARGSDSVGMVDARATVAFAAAAQPTENLRPDRLSVHPLSPLGSGGALRQASSPNVVASQAFQDQAFQDRAFHDIGLGSKTRQSGVADELPRAVRSSVLELLIRREELPTPAESEWEQYWALSEANEEEKEDVRTNAQVLCHSGCLPSRYWL